MKWRSHQGQENRNESEPAELSTQAGTAGGGEGKHDHTVKIGSTGTTRDGVGGRGGAVRRSINNAVRCWCSA